MRLLSLPKGSGRLIETIEDLREYFHELEDDGLLTWDWETTGLEYDCIPLGIALHQRGHDSCFCPVDFFFSTGLSVKELVGICNEEFPRFRMIGHNTKFDSMVNKMQGHYYDDSLV